MTDSYTTNKIIDHSTKSVQSVVQTLPGFNAKSFKSNQIISRDEMNLAEFPLSVLL